MPLVQESVTDAGAIGALPTPAPVETPSALDTAAAAFRQSNVVSSLYDRVTGNARPHEDVEGYDALDDVKGYERYADRFIDVNSPAESQWVKRKIDEELIDRKTLQDAGGWGLVATIGAAVVDPISLITMAIPGGGEARAVRVGELVSSQLAGDVATELALSNLQQTRTPEESALNIGSGALLAGVLGTLASRVPKAEFEKLRAEVGAELNAVDSTAGAAAVRRSTIEDETVARGGETLSSTLGRVSPGARLLNSPSVEARRVIQELSETPELLNKNFQGIATPTSIESLLKRAQGDWWVAYKERGSLYQSYRQRARAAGEKPLNRFQFSEQVSFAMRRGDTHEIPEVAQAAKRTRDVVFEPLKTRAQKLGLLKIEEEGGQAVTGAESYLMRKYNIAKIRRNPTEWTQLLIGEFEKTGIDKAEAVDIAHTVTRNILGSEHGTLDLKAFEGVVPKSGRLKERTLKLPDAVLEPWLVNDVDDLTQAYIRTLAPEIEMTQRFGDRDLKDALQKVKDEYGVLKARAIEKKDNKMLQSLNSREEADLRDISAVRDRLYGTFRAPKDPSSFFVRAGRTVRAVNFMRLLGGQTISALTDAARLIMVYGAPKMMATAARLATNISALKLSTAQARRMGIGLDMVLNTRGIALGDIGEYSTHAEQAALRRMSDVFSVATLQSPWNTIMKSWSSVMSQDDVIKAAQKISRGEQLSKFQTARMASLGFDNSLLERIAKQAETHGDNSSGLRMGNSDRWDDKEAGRLFEAGIIREVDNAVMTPGAGDLPLVYSTEWGKAILQFKSFSYASVRRLQIPVAQGFAAGDIKTMLGASMSFGIGAMVYALKQLTAEQPIETNPRRFALEMVDKSGMLAWSGDILYPSLWMLGSDDFSRWSDRQPVETLAGPVAGTIADTYASRWPAKAIQGELSPKDIHKMRRLLPGQNIFYLRRGVNQLEELTSDAVTQ
jgi:hypothetical protein